MPSWQLFTEDEAERSSFADLDKTLALPSRPAGPPNRLRHVVRIEVDGRVYFLKTFRRTQWKNRLHFLTTRPRARDDADRERRVTDALRASGFAAPRPVAYGRVDRAGYYLCAELDGSSLRELLAADRAPTELAMRCARHCGRLLAAGFALPDLSADHVFVGDDGDLSVLDLHNGTLVAPGRVGSKVLARVLRRFARSIRDLPVARTTAMRFAARLLRSAGCRTAERRRLLTAAQPFGTAGRYEQGTRSRDYAERNPDRHRQEQRLLQRVWPGMPGETVLDAPCGAGRLLPFLRERQHEVLQADGAFAMLSQARTRGDAAALLAQADALQLPLRDGAVDGVVMFRFLHHLPSDAADVAFAEACRIARRFVVVSFFHPCSTHHLRRRLKQWLGTPATRFAQPLRRIRRVAKRHGFELHRHAAQAPFVRDLWLASFTRIDGG